MSLTNKSSQLSAVMGNQNSPVSTQTLDKIRTPVVIKTDKNIGNARRSMSRRGFKLTPPKQNGLSSKLALRAESDLSRFSKYVMKATKTEPKIVRKTNPAGRTTDHVEYEVHGTLSTHKKSFKTKREAEEYFKTVKEEVDMYSQWSNKEPVEYAKYLTKHFGAPEELTEKRAIWYDKDGFKRIEVLDEYILHASPLPHYDFVYCYVDLKVPHNLANKLAESSESITIDFLKNEVGARCASLSANAVTINYVLDVVEGRITPSKQEYESQIKSMKNMFASGKKFELDWWPDESGDADPSNVYYKESHLTFFDFRKKLAEATYKGKTVSLNKPMSGDVKKSKVFVDPDGDGKAQKVNFGDKTMSIKKNIPSRKKSFMARHNCDSKTDKTSAGYWSCRAWK